MPSITQNEYSQIGRRLYFRESDHIHQPQNFQLQGISEQILNLTNYFLTIKGKKT